MGEWSDAYKPIDGFGRETVYIGTISSNGIQYQCVDKNLEVVKLNIARRYNNLAHVYGARHLDASDFDLRSGVNDTAYYTGIHAYILIIPYLI